jgi:hypothetical protein
MSEQAAGGIQHAKKVRPRLPLLAPCTPHEPVHSPWVDRMHDARGHMIAGIFAAISKTSSYKMSVQAAGGIRHAEKVRPRVPPPAPCSLCRFALFALLCDATLDVRDWEGLATLLNTSPPPRYRGGGAWAAILRLYFVSCDIRCFCVC